MRKIVGLTGVLAALLMVWPARDWAQAAPRHVRGQVIVKFRSDGPRALTQCAHCLLKNRQSFASSLADRSDSIDRLNQRFGVKTARSVFVSRDNLSTIQAQSKERQLREKILVKRRGVVRGVPAAPDLTNVYLVEVPNSINVVEAVRAYQADPHVEYAHPNYLVTINAFPQTLPNDPYVDPDQNGTWSTGAWEQSYEDLWGLKKIQADKAWVTAQGKDIIVAVIDTGVDYNHEDLAANIWTNPHEIPRNGRDDEGNGFVDDVRGWDAVSCTDYNQADECLTPKTPDNDPLDDNGHGTHVAGTIAALANNRKGIAGVAPRASVMAIKAFNAKGFGSDADLANALRYAADNGAAILNHSWSGTGTSALIQDAVSDAAAKGCLNVAAAGNDYGADAGNLYPANMPSVLAVAATDPSDLKALFSNLGSVVDVSAPGVAVLSTVPPATSSASSVAPGYARNQGTSMSTPHVAGAAAVLMSADRLASAADIQGRLMATADPLPPEAWAVRDLMGTGRINLAQAMTASRRPFFRARKVRWEDADGDGFLQAGEVMRIIVDLENVWKETAAVSATLSISGSTMATLVSGSSTFGSMASGATKNNQSNPFLMRIGTLPYALASLGCVITIQADGYRQTLPFEVLLGGSARRLAAGASPRISADTVVWVDTRHGNKDIYSYRLASQQERRMTTDPNDQEAPDINADLIAWVDWRNVKDPSGDPVVRTMDLEVYAYDLTARRELRITTLLGTQGYPRVGGRRIVWEDQRYRLEGLYGADLRTPADQWGRQVVAGNHTYGRDGFALDGNRMAFRTARQEVRFPGLSVIAGDLSLYEFDAIGGGSGSPRALVTSGTLAAPDISGRKIVYQDSRNGNWDIYLYDLDKPAGQQEMRLTANPAHQLHPKISGSRVVWIDKRHGGDDLYLFDLNRPPGQQERRLTADGARMPSPPDLSGDVVVWERLSASGLEREIYLAYVDGRPKDK